MTDSKPPLPARKAPGKTARKTAALAKAAAPKPAAKAAERASAAMAADAASVAKASKKPRPRLVRDSFTMPEADFAIVAALKSKALGARRAAKKSELLRAGLRALAALDAKSLVAALDALEAVKTGRPKKGH